MLYNYLTLLCKVKDVSGAMGTVRAFLSAAKAELTRGHSSIGSVYPYLNRENDGTAFEK